MIVETITTQISIHILFILDLKNKIFLVLWLIHFLYRQSRGDGD